MKKRACELSLPRFDLDRGCWCPTLDMSRFITNASGGIVDILWTEERNHRFLFLGTDVRLWMAWMEFLSNYEFIRLMIEMERLQNKNRNFVLHIPLDINLRHKKSPNSVKMRIENLINTCTAICLLQKICEPIIEAVTICSLTMAFEGPIFEPILNEIKRKKIEKYGLGSIYSEVEKLSQNAKERTLNLIQYVFGPMTDKSRKRFPVMKPSTYYRDFNSQVFQIIPRRFDEIIRLFGGESFSSTTLDDFLDQHFEDPENVQPSLLMKVGSTLDRMYENVPSEKIVRNISEVASRDDSVEDIVRPTLSLEELVFPLYSFLELSVEINKESREAFEKISIDPTSFEAGFALGTTPLFIIEDIGSQVEKICYFRLTPRREMFARATRKAYNVTDLKYFFLTGKSSNMYLRQSEDRSLLDVFLNNIRTEGEKFGN